MATSSSSLSLFLRDAGQFSSLNRLVEDIQDLGYRLARPDQQSDYFRWGLQNHTNSFLDLCAEYRRIGYWYNTHTVDDMLDERAQHLQLSRSLVAGEMNMGRAIRVNAAMARIAWLDECLRLKAVMRECPPLDDLLDGKGCDDMR